VLYTLCGFLFLSFVLVLWIKEDLKKLEYEEGRRKIERSDVS
jgi:hypothetical protein